MLTLSRIAIVAAATLSLTACSDYMSAEEFSRVTQDQATVDMIGKQKFTRTVCVPKGFTKADIDAKVGVNAIDTLIQFVGDSKIELDTDRPVASFMTRTYENAFPCKPV